MKIVNSRIQHFQDVAINPFALLFQTTVTHSVIQSLKIVGTFVVILN